VVSDGSNGKDLSFENNELPDSIEIDEILKDENAYPSMNAKPRERTIDPNQFENNISDSILLSRESDSNEIGESDSQTE
jgi:hypothetical protein